MEIPREEFAASPPDLENVIHTEISTYTPGVDLPVIMHVESDGPGRIEYFRIECSRLIAPPPSAPAPIFAPAPAPVSSSSSEDAHLIEDKHSSAMSEMFFDPRQTILPPKIESTMDKSGASRCRPCATSYKPVSATIVAVIVLLAVVLIFYMIKHLGGAKENFATQRAHEVYTSSRDLLNQTQGNATYSEFKTAVDGADAVLHSDARRLWKAGRLTPDEIQKVI